MTLYTDEEAVQGIQQGNTADLQWLVQRHHSPLLGYLYRMTNGDRALAEDLVQETFLKMMRSIHHYQYPRPVKPWLYTIATNLTRDYYGKAEMRHTQSVQDESMWEMVEDTQSLPEQWTITQNEGEQVAQLIGKLPASQRETLILRYYEGLSLKEISTILDIPVGTVKSRLSLALRRLRDQLST